MLARGRRSSNCFRRVLLGGRIIWHRDRALGISVIYAWTSIARGFAASKKLREQSQWTKSL
jgi:hypothetical protein